MEIIDCHANIGWDVNNLRKNQYPVEQSFQKLLEKMEHYGITKAIVVPFPSPGGQFDENTPWYFLENRYLINANNFSKRLIPFPAVNPNDERSVRQLKELAISFRIKGVKISHQIPMDFPIDKLIEHPLMKVVQDDNLVMMVHIGTGKEKGVRGIHTTLNYALKAAKHYPEVKFILCHLGRLHWSLIEALNLKNVWLDTASLSLWQKWPQFIAREPIKMLRSSTPIRVIEKLMEIGYEDKLVFGSDEPYTHYKEELSYVKDADIPERLKRKVLFENIQKLLNIR